jgi:rod shape-determining protein MreD
MMLFGGIVPVLTVAVCAILAVLPWGAVDWARLALPLLPMSAIYFWTVRKPQTMSAGLVFIVGLFIDVMTHGPLGFWSLIYLVGAAIGRLESKRLPVAGQTLRLISFAFVAAVLGILQWSVLSVYSVRWIEWPPFALAGLAAIASQAVVTIVLSPLNNVGDVDPDQPLVRGGF